MILRNYKFYILATAILLTSVLLLVGCMHVIASDYGGAKQHNIEDVDIINIDGNIIMNENAPLAQTELHKKFDAMYEISDDGKNIKVISTEYLNNFWRSNYDNEVIHSLSTEEVYFIIQDSIRIYFLYDKIVLPRFASVSSISKVAGRFPFVEEREVGIQITSHHGRDKVEKDIHAIIMYRLKVLSSPQAFFTGAEAIRFVGGDSTAYDGFYPESVFYIPGYSVNTDKDYILSIMGGNTSFTDLERFTDLFEVSIYDGVGINFLSIANGSTTKVFPTEELDKTPILETTPCA